jgi:hypothetical protein
MLLIEPQPWKCYRNAAKRLRRKKLPPHPHFSELKMRESVVDDMNKFLLEECGFSSREALGTTAWGRGVFLYRTDNAKQQEA